MTAIKEINWVAWEPPVRSQMRSLAPDAVFINKHCMMYIPRRIAERAGWPKYQYRAASGRLNVGIDVMYNLSERAIRLKAISESEHDSKTMRASRPHESHGWLISLRTMLHSTFAESTPITGHFAIEVDDNDNAIIIYLSRKLKVDGEE